jgi:hypothetical protein
MNESLALGATSFLFCRASFAIAGDACRVDRAPRFIGSAPPAVDGATFVPRNASRIVRDASSSLGEAPRLVAHVARSIATAPFRFGEASFPTDEASRQTESERLLIDEASRLEDDARRHIDEASPWIDRPFLALVGTTVAFVLDAVVAPSAALGRFGAAPVRVDEARRRRGAGLGGRNEAFEVIASAPSISIVEGCKPRLTDSAPSRRPVPGSANASRARPSRGGARPADALNSRDQSVPLQANTFTLVTGNG